MSVDDKLALVRDRVRSVPDFPKPGILFRDITPILTDPDALGAALDLHVHLIDDLKDGIDRVVGIESRGFLFGMSLAARIGTGFALIRKPGKLPCETVDAEYELEYGTDRIEIHKDALGRGDRVLIVDDLLATGGTAAAALSLVAKLGATPVAAVFLIELEALRGRAKLEGVRIESVLRF